MLEVDVSESTVRNHATVVIPELHRIHGIGARIAVSDFGSGCSAWRDLKHLPAHSLHLGRSVVQGVESERCDAATVVAALAFARQMQRPICAEGIETQAQHHFLRDHGCDIMQGYLFGRPMPASSIPELLVSTHGTPAQACSG